MSGIRTTLAAIAAMATALAVPAGLVLATSQPAQACTLAPTRTISHTCGTGTTYSVSATPSTVAEGDPVTLTMSQNVGTSTTDVTAQATFTMDSGTCLGNVCTSALPGTHTVSGHYNGRTASTSVSVLVPDHVTISPVYMTVIAGQSVTYTVTRVTADGTVIDDVSSRATVTLGGVPCPGAVCTTRALDEQIVTATFGSLSAGGAVMVRPGPAVSLAVGGQLLTPWSPSQPGAFTARAFDAVGNDLGDVTQQSTFSVAPGGYCYANLCTPDSAGRHTVTATDGSISGSLTLYVGVPPVVAQLPAGTVGSSYSTSVLTYDDTMTSTTLGTSGSTPPGVTLASDGTLSGTPTTAGTYTFDVIAQNIYGSQDMATTLTIAPAPAPMTPQVSVSNSAVREGNSGRTAVPVTVTLSRASSTPVTVAWHTANGTALAGQDYVAAHGTVTIPAGQLTGQLTVSVIGDRKVEPNERFRIVLTNAHFASLGTARATVTVTNDD